MKQILLINLMIILSVQIILGQMKSDKSNQTNKTEAEIKRLEDEWLNSYLRGDKPTFDRIVADDFSGTDETGRVRSKTEERNLVQLPSGAAQVLMVNQNVRVRLYQDTAIVTGQVVQKFDAGNSGGFSFQSQFTDTFLKRNGRWQVISRHYSRLPKERTAVRTDPNTYDAYSGEYEIAPNVVVMVTKEADKLMSQVAGQPKMELLPESEVEFFIKGLDCAFIFVRDESGQTAKLIINQGGQRITARRLK